MGNSPDKQRKCDRKAIEKEIKHVLEKHGEISFAYLHGSFVKEACIFRDIDVAVYIEKRPESVLEYELGLETRLMKALDGYIIDVKVLNTAPLSFRYNVIKNGSILLAKDDDKRADFEEITIAAYLDFSRYRDMYLKETLGVEI